MDDREEGSTMTIAGYIISPSFAALLAIWLFGAALAITLELREIRRRL